MFQTLIVASLAASAVAFRPAAFCRPTLARVSMTAQGLAGESAPFGFFDPLSLSAGKTDGEVKKIREAELKHGRVAMVAFLGIIVGENANPLFDGKISGPAIYQFQQADDLVSYFWVGVLFFIALIEGQNILNGWESKSETNNRKSVVAELKEDYINGDLGFDPLGLTPTDSDEFDALRTKELNNGRLAMLGVAGIVAQELVNGKTILENFAPVAV
jgi:light-harvesting complex I chlorophyll a/b binding protein 1